MSLTRPTDCEPRTTFSSTQSDLIIAVEETTKTQ